MSQVSEDLLLQPRDGLFTKDGRGWYNAGAGRSYVHDWPPPSTVAGALRTAYGRTQAAGQGLTPEDWSRIRDEVGPGVCLALRLPLGATPDRSHRLWPAPADALWLDTQPPAVWLDPIESTVPTLGSDDDEARERLWWPKVTPQAGKPRTGPRWWTEDWFADWLKAQPVTWPEEANWPDPPRRLEVHVAIDHDKGAAAEGQLFQHDVIETTVRQRGQSYDYALACRVELPSGSLVGQRLTLGGKRRLVTCAAAPSALFDPPDGLLAALTGQRRFRLVVVTPVDFAAGWRPDGLVAANGVYRGRLGEELPEVILRAAYVGRPLHVSGWDLLAKQPKPTRRLVPPGAVYFCELAGGATLSPEQAQSLWLAALGRDTAEGFGRVVPGLWPEQGA